MNRTIILRCVLQRCLPPRVVLRALLVAVCLAGCVADPEPPGDQVVRDAPSGVIVVNEGVWRQDNATLTLYQPATGVAVQDYFTLRNPGLRLGDVANSIAVRDSVAYVAVSTSRTVEVLACRTGLTLGRVMMPPGNEPRQIAFLDSTTAFVSCFGDSVVEFDPRTLQVRRVIAVGPAPEGIACAQGHVFVAVSGLGFYRQQEPGAGTLAVIDPASGRVVASVLIGPNPRPVVSRPSAGLLYVLYGLPDSVGGIAELDVRTLSVRRRWPLVNARDLAIDDATGQAYAITGDGVVRVDLTEPAARPVVFVPATDWPGRIFYAIAASPDGGVYVCSLVSYTAPGEVLVFNRAGTRTARFASGINPGDVGFY